VADGNDDAPARSGPRLRAMPFKSNMLCPMPFEEDMPYTLNFPANEVCSHEKVCHIGEYAFSRYMPYMRVDCTYTAQNLCCASYSNACLAIQLLCGGKMVNPSPYAVPRVSVRHDNSWIDPGHVRGVTSSLER
jgi:hypothetical protein